ncbi:MAG: type I-E CRISPR-associated protein Cas5/CasD [Thermodesulfobacteriota bacterium]
MDCLLLRFDAPIMSFGGVCVDQINPTDLFPGNAMITGLIGNALGWDHRDTDSLDRLQDRLRVASRWDAEPQRLIDYHTVFLGQDHLVGTGWTTHGQTEARGSGQATSGTHIRYRHYLANGVLIAAVTIVGNEFPTLQHIENALKYPARPLFIGRKTCIPSGPILIGLRHAAHLIDALRAEPLTDIGPRRRPQIVTARWPADDGIGQLPEAVYDRRDWSANMPRGVHHYFSGPLEMMP